MIWVVPYVQEDSTVLVESEIGVATRLVVSDLPESSVLVLVESETGVGTKALAL